MSTTDTPPVVDDVPETPETPEATEPTAEDRLAKLETDLANAKKINRDLEKKLKASPEENARYAAALAAEKAKAAGETPDPEAIKAEARKEALAEATAKANEKLVRAEAKAAAAGKLSHPSDAVKFLDLSEFEVDDDGNVDETAIADAIEALIKERPDLAAQGGKRFQGSGDGGARNGQAAKPQLTGEDIKGWSPEAIVAAKAEGRLRDHLGHKQN